ncbi:MAG: ABC transporter permease [Planctomycetota bacterium]|jgi:lipoprotein-releasing system permease protein
MLKLFLTLRYLRKKKVVSLSVIAVAISVTLLIVVSSLFTGFIEVFERSAVDTIGDVVVFPPIHFTDYQDFIQRLERANIIERATPVLSAQGLVHLEKGNVRPVNIWGIDPVSHSEVTTFRESLIRQKSSLTGPSFGASDSNGIVRGFVGIGVLAEPDEKTDEYDMGAIKEMIGTNIVLTTGKVAQQTVDNQTGPRMLRKTLRFTIEDVVFSGVYDLDKRFIYVPIEKLHKLLYPQQARPVADQVQIKLSEQADIEAALAQVRGLWEDFAEKQLGWDKYNIRQTTITTAKELQRQFVIELQKQMAVLMLIFGVVSSSVIVLIFCIFYMIVETRQKDIAIIKSCGSSSSSVVSVFIGLGACVGMMGSIIGIICAYIITLNINPIEKWISSVLGLKLWKSSVYMFSKIPNEVDLNIALKIIFFAILAAAIGSFIPAIVAAKTKPVKILRYE